MTVLAPPFQILDSDFRYRCFDMMSYNNSIFDISKKIVGIGGERERGEKKGGRRLVAWGWRGGVGGGGW